MSPVMRDAYVLNEHGSIQSRKIKTGIPLFCRVPVIFLLKEPLIK